MSAREFVWAHEWQDHSMHPLNVIDAYADVFPAIASQFVLPDVAKEVSLGHIYMKKYPQLLADKVADFTSSSERFLLMSEAGSVTDWHQDFTGTCVRYEIVHGQKVFSLVLNSANNLAKFLEWQDSPDDLQVYVLSN